MMANTKKNTEKPKASNGKTKNASGNKPETNSQLQKFFEDSLKDIYWAEKEFDKGIA